MMISAILAFEGRRNNREWQQILKATVKSYPSFPYYARKDGARIFKRYLQKAKEDYKI